MINHPHKAKNCYVCRAIITLGKNHAWSKYEGLANELSTALTALEGVFAGASEDAQKAYNTVVASNAKVSQRFPSGLGALIKSCKGLDGASEQLEVLHRVRTAQMARQQAIGQANSMITESAWWKSYLVKSQSSLSIEMVDTLE